jgi:hypothetical protein
MAKYLSRANSMIYLSKNIYAFKSIYVVKLTCNVILDLQGPWNVIGLRRYV